MNKRLTFIEEAEFKGFKYRSGGLLGNGFMAMVYIYHLPRWKNVKIFKTVDKCEDADRIAINTDCFIEMEEKLFYTNDVLKLFRN